MMKMAGLMLVVVMAGAQAMQAQASVADKAAKERADKMVNAPTETFYLKNSSDTNDGNQIVTTLRNMLDPTVRLMYVQEDEAIVVRGLQEDLAMASKLISELDRPRKTYRVTFTVTEVDQGKRIGTQHFAMTLAAGQRTTLKEGSKVPVVTGSYSDGTKGPQGVQSQFTYLDVGMNFDVTLEEVAGGARVQSKFEQSSVAEDKLITGVQEPVIRQSVLTGTSFLVMGKPLMIGSIDVPGSTRHMDVEVMAEAVP